jgi:hypothetical protein
MTTIRARFPSDHPIEELRGERRPDRSQIQRSIQSRIEWLRSKIVANRGAGIPASYLVEELGAITVLLTGIVVKRCGCGASYDQASWDALEAIGLQGERNCTACGSTITMAVSK